MSAHQLQPADRDEGPDVDRLRGTDEHEQRQAGVPERAEHVRAVGEQDAVRRPEPPDDEHQGDRRAAVPPDERRLAESQRRQVHQAVPGRHEGRHVVEAVDVDLERRAEDVLHHRGEPDDDDRLGPDRGTDSPQHGRQQQPGEQTQPALLPHPAAAAGPVEPEHDGEPAHHRQDGPGGQLASHPAHPRRDPTVRG